MNRRIFTILKPTNIIKSRLAIKCLCLEKCLREFKRIINLQ